MIVIDYSLIGGRIKQARREKGLTQEKLAECLHVSVGYISQLERGITKINLETLGKISEATDREPSFFIDGSVPFEPSYALTELQELFGKLTAKEKEITLRLLKSYIEGK